MDTYSFDDIELEFEVRGSGDGVVLIHASPFVSWYEPLLPHLHGLAVLRYSRHLKKTGNSYRPLSIDEDALICVRLLDHIGWARAHAVGHSYGALVALGLAMNHPERVRTISLIEPAARGVSSSEQVAAALAPVAQTYKDGDSQRAMDMFLQHVCGPGYRADLDRLLPNAFLDAVAEADLFFQAEMAAVRSFQFDPDQAREISQPVLNMVAANTVPRFVEGAALVNSWFPEAEQSTVPDAGHMLIAQNPSAVGESLVDFFARNPIGSRVPSA